MEGRIWRSREEILAKNCYSHENYKRAAYLGVDMVVLPVTGVLISPVIAETILLV